MKVKHSTPYEGVINLANLIFKLDSWTLGAGFFPIATTILLSYKGIRDSDFKKKKFIIMKREVHI